MHFIHLSTLLEPGATSCLRRTNSSQAFAKRVQEYVSVPVRWLVLMHAHTSGRCSTTVNRSGGSSSFSPRGEKYSPTSLAVTGLRPLKSIRPLKRSSDPRLDRERTCRASHKPPSDTDSNLQPVLSKQSRRAIVTAA